MLSKLKHGTRNRRRTRLKKCVKLSGEDACTQHDKAYAPTRTRRVHPPGEDEVGHRQAVPCRVVEEPVAATFIVHEYHHHQAQPATHRPIRIMDRVLVNNWYFTVKQCFTSDILLLTMNTSIIHCFDNNNRSLAGQVYVDEGMCNV